MLFSIIIPVYNAQEVLERCLESILSQSFCDFEVILVDDGSKDESGKICDEYAKKDLRIKSIHTDNFGSTHARKTGANLANGDYILCLDSDDTFADGFLAQINQDIILNPSIPVFIYNMNCIFQDKTEAGKMSLAPGIYAGKDMQLIRKKLIFDEEKKWPNNGSISYTVWGKAIKREVFQSSQNEVNDDTSIGEDMLVIVKIINRINSLFISDYIGYNYYINNNSMTHVFKLEQIKKIQNATNYLYIEVEEKNKAYVFALSNFILQTNMIAKNYKYKEYRRMLKIIKKQFSLFWNYAYKAKIKKAGLKQKIHLFLYKNKMYFIIYCYYKLCGRK